MMLRNSFISRLAYMQDANMVLRAAGYRHGAHGGVMKDADINRIERAITYGVSPDEFADAILSRDGYRSPRTTADVGGAA